MLELDHFLIIAKRMKWQKCRKKVSLFSNVFVSACFSVHRRHKIHHLAWWYIAYSFWVEGTFFLLSIGPLHNLYELFWWDYLWSYLLYIDVMLVVIFLLFFLKDESFLCVVLLCCIFVVAIVFETEKYMNCVSYSRPVA